MRIDCVEYADSRIVAKNHDRTGKCDFIKCKAACCKFSILNVENRKPAIEYFKCMGFKSETIDGNRYLILEKPCKHLNLKTSKCKIYKRRPIPCKHFPIPTDTVYLKVASICSYKFKTEKREIKRLPKNI